MKNFQNKELKSFIEHLSTRIHQLRAQSEISSDANKAYNRLLIERACAGKKLSEIQSKNIISFLGKKLSFKPKQKVIADYFNSK